MAKRILLALCVTLFVGLASVGLTQDPDVTVWSISVEQDDLYAEVEAAFNERYPEYTVEFETFSQDAFNQNLPLSFESGDAPDVILASFDLPMSELLANEWIAPVAGDTDIPEEWFDRFPESTFVNGHNMVEDVVYGVPNQEQDIWGPGYMYFNRTVLQEAGVDPETEIPETWSELLAVCERIKEADFPCFSASFDSDSNLRRWWTPYTSMAQSWTPFNYQTGEFAYDDEARLRAWDLLKTLYDGEHFIPGVETTDRETSRQVFALDQAAFYMDGAWMPSVFGDMGFPDLDFGVAPTPRPDDGVQGAIHKSLITSRLHVTSAVRNPEAAWALIDFLTEPEGMYAEGYVGGGFGFLSFTDNNQWIDPNDEVLADLVAIGQDYRKFEPVPLLACGDMEASTAYNDALQDPTVAQEEASIVEALSTDQDWREVAAGLSAERQALFEANIAAEQAEGLSINEDYFTYPDWAFDTSYDYDNYPLCN